MIVAVAVAALVAGGTLVWRHTIGRPEAASCRVTIDSASYKLDPEQATNATTITAVAKRLGLPDHAVTVGLAAALQESHLHNLDHGDRDSLGLFQQRPSQGWGTEAQVTDPVYAAAAFFTHLSQVEGWETLSVTAAVQAVQRSGAPDAYARWEAEARVLARATTGEVPAAFTCRTELPSRPSVDPDIDSAMRTELGAVDLNQDVSAGARLDHRLVARRPRPPVRHPGRQLRRPPLDQRKRRVGAHHDGHHARTDRTAHGLSGSRPARSINAGRAHRRRATPGR